MTKSNRYEHGYLPKIAYWMFNGDLGRVRYFIARQEEVYGEISLEDEVLVEGMVADLKAETDRKTIEELNEFVAKRFPNVIGV